MVCCSLFKFFFKLLPMPLNQIHDQSTDGGTASALQRALKRHTIHELVHINWEIDSAGHVRPLGLFRRWLRWGCSLRHP